MTKADRKRFKRNCFKERFSCIMSSSRNEYPSTFIGSGFVWWDSPEGHEYWRNIEARITTNSRNVRAINKITNNEKRKVL